MIFSTPKVMLSLVLAVFVYSYAFTQTVPYPKIETPNTASLGKYGDIPVSYFTGTPSISFPLYNLVEGNIQIPISLSYHSGSVKPNEHPGWVGLGWNLNCYGKITRTVKEWTDEGNNGSSFIKPYYPDPQYHGTQNGAAYINTNDWDIPSRIQTVYTYNPQSPAHFYDSNADEFSFNFGNYSGKFYYTANGWQVISDEPNIKIQELGFMDWEEINLHLVAYQLPGIGGGFAVQSRMFRGFIITTPDGTKYTFGSIVSTGYNAADGVEFAKDYPVSGGVFCNSWLLRKIEDRDGKSIVFEYQKKQPVCALSFYTTYTDYECYYDWSSASSWSTGGVNTHLHGGFLEYPVYLKKISTSKESINFNISTTTELRYTDEYLRYGSYDPQLLEYNLSALYSDVNNLQWYKLDDIVIQDVASTPNLIKKVKFNYSSITSQRLTLNSFSEQDKLSVNIKNYQFTYNDIAGLPAYGGDKTDHWGFYNGTGLQDASFSNLINLRNTNATLITKGMLQSVTYPTGGKTEFVWESNFAGNVVSIDRQSLGAYAYGYVGGVRIKEIKNYGIAGGTPLTTSYYYVKNYTNSANVSTLSSSGVLNGLPQYYFNIPTRVASDNSSRVGYRLESVNSLVSYSYNGSASHVGYSEVIEKLPDNSYNKYVYTNFNKYDADDEDHYDKSPGVIGWILGGLEDRYVTMSSLEGERGKLIAKEVYRNDNKLMEKTRNFYRKDASRFNDFIKMYDIRNSLACESYGSVILASAYKAFKYIFYIVKTEKSVYDINGTNAVTTTTTFDYNTYNQVSRTQTMQSNNFTLINKFKYPSDFSIVSAPSWDVAALQEMKSRNIITPFVETQVVKGGGSGEKLIKGTLIKYRNFGGNVIRPNEELQAELAAPSEDVTWLTIDASNQMVYNSAYKPFLMMNNYDAKGNILQVTERSGIITSYDWGYNSTYPVVEIKNALNSSPTYNIQTVSSTYDFTSSGGGVNFTATSGTIKIRLSISVGNTYSMQYTLVGGGTSKLGTLCASGSSTPCSSNLTQEVTFTNMPAGNYSLSFAQSDGSSNILRSAFYEYDTQVITTPAIKNFFHTSFEETEGNSTVGDARTGKLSHIGVYTKALSNLTAGTYILSYWQKSGSSWTYMESKVPVTGTTYSISLGSSTTQIDEVRLYPVNAQMTTYTYEPLIGMTSQCDANNRITYYEYDGFGRLKTIRDQDKNVIKTMDYQYQKPYNQ